MKLRTKKLPDEEWVDHDLEDEFQRWAFGKAITAFEELGVERMELEYESRARGLVIAEFTKGEKP